MPKRGGRRSTAPKSQKVTARFSNEEYDRLERLGQKRGEKLSALVRNLVLGTVEEVRERLGRDR